MWRKMKLLREKLRLLLHHSCCVDVPAGEKKRSFSEVVRIYDMIMDKYN